MTPLAGNRQVAPASSGKDRQANKSDETMPEARREIHARKSSSATSRPGFYEIRCIDPECLHYRAVGRTADEMGRGEDFELLSMAQIIGGKSCGDRR